MDNRAARQLLAKAGLKKEKAESILSAAPADRARLLAREYGAGMDNKRLAALLKAMASLVEREAAAAFFQDIIAGPPVAAQLMTLRICERPEWSSVPLLEAALKAYRSDFDSLTQAFSYYQDRQSCRCKGRSHSRGEDPDLPDG